MKGAPDVIASLNEVLKGEITARNQSFLHAAMCKMGGNRILFVEGVPVLNEPFTLAVGHDVKVIFEKDLRVECAALPRFKKGIGVCLELEDTGTPEMLEHILVDSEEHIAWLETQLHLIAQVGPENDCAQPIQPTS